MLLRVKLVHKKLSFRNEFVPIHTNLDGSQMACTIQLKSSRRYYFLPNQTKCAQFLSIWSHFSFKKQHVVRYYYYFETISRPLQEFGRNHIIVAPGKSSMRWYFRKERHIALTDTTKREKEKKQEKKAFELFFFCFFWSQKSSPLCAWIWGGVLPNMLFFMKYIHSKWEDVKNSSAMVVILSILTH